MNRVLPSAADLDAVYKEKVLVARTAVRRINCRKCGCEQFKLVCPVAWPFTTVAVGCSKCGATICYLDQRISRELLRTEEVREKPPREFVVSRRIAKKMHDDPDVIEQLILMGLENGVSIADAAQAADVSLQYAHAIAVKYGYRRKAS